MTFSISGGFFFWLEIVMSAIKMHIYVSNSSATLDVSVKSIVVAVNRISTELEAWNVLVKGTKATNKPRGS